VLARDATLASALGERDALRRRLALPNVRVALRGEAFLDVIGIVSSVGFATEVSHCRELCRLTRDIVQRGDVADMLAQSLRLQCGAREARAAGRENFVDDAGVVFEGTTRLIRAVALNNLPRVLQLVQLGAPLDLVDKTHRRSALHWACLCGHEHVAKALLDGKSEGHGATIDLRTGAGSTPLLAATGRRQDAIVRLLLSRGARQELQDSLNGYTALHWAVHWDHSSILTLLCAAPGAAAALALKSSAARGSRTPLALAIHYNSAACEAVLRAHGAPE
jgi:ankyrin repeat protein